MRPALRNLFLSSLLIVVPDIADAQWINNGRPATLAPGSQSSVQAVSDGLGGVVLVWVSDSPDYDIYAQRLNAQGVPQWATNGVVVCNALNNQLDPQIVADGSGSVIIVWEDARGASVDIYAQRLLQTGVPQWGGNGVVVCNFATNQTDPRLICDASARAIITWTDLRNGNEDIYAQRLNSAGVPQWMGNGVPVIVFTGIQRQPRIVPDGSTGVIVVWEDNASGNYDLYAQRLNVSGVQQWFVNGLVVCNAALEQAGHSLISDGVGGIVSTWHDFRNSASFDIYAQRLNSSGVAYWAANGVPVCTAASTQIAPKLVSDGGAGAIIAWDDARADGGDIYAQHITDLGAGAWKYNGVGVCVAPNSQVDAKIAPDAYGGAVVSWIDFRNGATTEDIYAQRVDAWGSTLWNVNGVAVCDAYFIQDSPAIVGAGSGACFVSWRDIRGTSQDIYAQRIEPRYGEWGIPEAELKSVLDNPADQGGKVVVRWFASDRDLFNDPLISHYSIWRSTDLSAVSTAANNDEDSKVTTDPREVGPDFSGSAVYVEKRPQMAGAYWEWVANQDAMYVPSYSYTAATRQDSVAGEPALHYFRIFSHSRVDPTRIWESADMGGYSVDNLAPGAPLLLTAQRVGADVHLKWNRAVAPDLRDYAIYRASSIGVTPVSTNFLANSEDTVAVDASAPGTALYYIVTAFDVHANQSDPSNEANVGATTGVGNLPVPTVLTMQQNAPNPFTGETKLRIGLPEKSDVTIEVYDVGGRRVARRTLPAMSAGWQSIAFDGRDDGGRLLASGVYFSKVIAAGATRTQKMVIQR